MPEFLPGGREVRQRRLGPAATTARERLNILMAPTDAGRLDGGLLDDRPDRDDGGLELQLGVRDAGRDANQLREVEDRHLVALTRRLLELRLPGVEREVAQRAGRDHRVRPGLHGLLDRLDQLAERGLL